jgi:predicted nucleic acid-binding protein
MGKKRIVVDASVMVKWIRREKEELLDQADLLLKHLQENKVELYAPELAKYEVGNVFVKRKLIVAEAYNSLTTYYKIPITFLPETKEFVDNTYKIAAELEITYYDAAYVTLAENYMEY